MTSPPPQGLAPARLASGATGTAPAANEVVEMSLGDRGKAVLAVLPATTAGSELNVVLTDDRGQRLRASQSTSRSATRVAGWAGSPSR